MTAPPMAAATGVEHPRATGKQAGLLAVKRAVFRTLEMASEAASRWRGHRPAEQPLEPSAQPSLWIYVSTVGELNAIDPFIQQLLQALGQPPLTLLSDRSNYGTAYAARFPQASVVQLQGTASEVAKLVRQRPPLMLLVAEIPCLLHDAPCRFSFATVDAVRRLGAPVVLVNGWTYGYAPPSRLDRIENRLFSRDYVCAFDLMTVQTEDVRSRLLQAGADPQRVVVTGNIKFDAVFQTRSQPQPSALADALHRRGEGPVIVAGSVTETADQRAVLQAFKQVLARHPRALLVLAPRHPENRERMAALQGLLEEMQLGFGLRSRLDDEQSAAGPVLVLDTMGELRHVYRAATLAYVGTDHNVLEPLAYGCPVFVSGGWNPTYPSFPVYTQLAAAGALLQVESSDALGSAWSEFAGMAARERQGHTAFAATALSQAAGATQRCMTAIQSLLPSASNHADR